MKFNKTLTLLLIALVVGLLSACGSNSAIGGLKAGEIKEISFNELIEKLDDEETFLLLPYFYSYDDFVESGLSEVIEEQLDEHGVGVHYAQVSLEKEDEDKYDKLASYVHPENEVYDETDFWRPTSDGLVYVKEGNVMTLISSQVFVENSNSTPFGTQMDINELSNHEYYGESVNQSLIQYKNFEIE